MSSLVVEPSAETQPTQQILTSKESPSPTAPPGRSQLEIRVLVGTVFVAIAGGVLFTWLFHSFSATKPPPVAASSDAGRLANSGVVKDRSLEIIGSLTAAQLYQGFLNIGLLADAQESEMYTKAESQKLLDSVTLMLDTADRRLASLLEENLEEEDLEAVKRAHQLSGLIRVQARELRAYWQTSDKVHADKFQQARDKSWAGIQEVLGIED